MERPSRDDAAFAPPDHRSTTVAICVATYRRPRMLAELLRSLGELTFDREAVPEVVVVVIDNDVSGSARSVVLAARPNSPWPIHYEIEPERNISLARNRAVAVALAAGAEYLAFVDDDERVTPRWLIELLRARERYAADAVFGPVVGVPTDGGCWLVEEGFFHSRRHRTGSGVPLGNTCNALIAADLFSGAGADFDPRFGTSGGGDNHFFMRARDRGARYVWADDAVVEESIPPSRARVGWVLRRSFRIGHAYVACRRDLLPLHRWLLPSIAEALARIGWGLLLLPVGLPRGRPGIVSALRRVSQGTGAIAGILGFSYHEYTRIHGN